MATPLQCNLIAVVESSTVSTDILGPTYSLFPYGTRTLNMYLVVPRHLEQTPLRINQKLSDPVGCQQDSMQHAAATQIHPGHVSRLSYVDITGDWGNGLTKI